MFMHVFSLKSIPQHGTWNRNLIMFSRIIIVKIWIKVLITVLFVYHDYCSSCHKCSLGMVKNVESESLLWTLLFKVVYITNITVPLIKYVFEIYSIK
jgi:cytochrome c1